MQHDWNYGVAHCVGVNDSMQSACALGGGNIHVTDYGMLETAQPMHDRGNSWFDLSLWRKYGDAFMQMCRQVCQHFVNTDHDNDMIAKLTVPQNGQ